MPLIDLYSKRKRRIETGNQSEIYQYDNLPLAFRRQVIHIWRDAIGIYQFFMRDFIPHENYQLWTQIHDSLARELGLFELSLSPSRVPHPFEQCQNFFLNESTPNDYLLDLIEMTFYVIDKTIREGLENPAYFDASDISQHPDDAISELNHRFREHEIGYQFESS